MEVLCGAVPAALITNFCLCAPVMCSAPPLIGRHAAFPVGEVEGLPVCLNSWLRKMETSVRFPAGFLPRSPLSPGQYLRHCAVPILPHLDLVMPVYWNGASDKALLGTFLVHSLEVKD